MSAPHLSCMDARQTENGTPLTVYGKVAAAYPPRDARFGSGRDYPMLVDDGTSKVLVIPRDPGFPIYVGDQLKLVGKADTYQKDGRLNWTMEVPKGGCSKFEGEPPVPGAAPQAAAPEVSRETSFSPTSPPSTTKLRPVDALAIYQWAHAATDSTEFAVMMAEEYCAGRLELPQAMVGAPGTPQDFKPTKASDVPMGQDDFGFNPEHENIHSQHD